MGDLGSGEGVPTVKQNGTHDVDVMIIGAGPSGATTALLLSKLGISSLVVSRHSGTSPTPRAHLFNQRAMEVMRDAGIEADLLKAATPRQYMQHTSWTHSLNGEEYARLYFQGAGWSRKGDYERASPCEIVDLPQMRFEPILIEKVKEAGVEVLWRMEFVSQKEVDGGRLVETVLRERDANVERRIRSKYLVGADGARSVVLQSLGIPVDGKQLNSVFNVHIRADLSRFIQDRPGVLNWVLNPDAPQWSAVGNFRMVKPWTEFAVSMHPAATEGGVAFEPTHDDIRARMYQMIGADRDVVGDIEILSVSRWHVNNQVAREYQKGRVICIGDAVHRHPPINGLGSNTCVSDAMNISWKLAYVIKAVAHPRILDTITLERKPVGDGVVRRANEGMEEHRRLWKVIGLDKEERIKKLELMSSVSLAGSKLREEWWSAIKTNDREGNALGIQMNQQYCASPLSVTEPDDTEKPDVAEVDLEMDLVVSTFSGYHLPHVWVVPIGQSQRISTLDVCGRGRFTLLTGLGGDLWRQYANEVNARRPGLDLQVASIGWRQEYHDAYDDWRNIRGVDDDGAVLVRPDHFVCWRCKSVASVHPGRLAEVLEQLLPAPLCA
ncbi:hypothetical protein CKM354_000629200 [Cercospora kikuchii]|uniref:FAD-binding domain-containing protein n=1 Tax=Cercospora kikuchii TaxID=84275 RepID=A0A9P3CRD4_9PEZI|nr:uncharacterized protein CKM354_000629200 [Cercospora kikuchii]GIZ43048.1 hypothetical protein CKM354_000629200 [Cercospora kikuchii]